MCELFKIIDSWTSPLILWIIFSRIETHQFVISKLHPRGFIAVNLIFIYKFSFVITVLEIDSFQRPGRNLWDARTNVPTTPIFKTTLFLWSASIKGSTFLIPFYSHSFIKQNKTLRVIRMELWRRTHLSVRPCKCYPLTCTWKLSSFL